MDNSNKIYILRLANSMLKEFDGKAVQNLLRMGAFHPHDYLFDCEGGNWVRPVDCKGLFELGQFDESMSFEKPNFLPPPRPATPVPPSELESLKRELSTLRHDYNNKLGVIQALKDTREDIKEDFEKVIHEKSELEEELKKERDEGQIARTDLVNANLEIDELKGQIENLEKQVDDLLTMKEDLLDLKGELDQKQEALQEELTTKELSYESFKAENKSLEHRIEELLEENEKLKKKQSIYRDYVANERKRANSYSNDIEKLSAGIIKLKSLRKKDQIAIRNLENYKKTQANKEARELNRLIGDSFEIDNSPHWFIEMEGEVKGPFRYHDMRSLHRFGKVDSETPVKKKHDPFWTSFGKDFELSANVITHSEVVKGEEVFRYFVNRSDYRAPFHGAAKIEIDGVDYTGFCTSLSVGGAFIELAELPLGVEKGATATIRINEGTLSQDLTAPVFLRNFSDAKPCGIGLQFQTLDDEQRNVIISYVSSYLENSKKTA